MEDNNPILELHINPTYAVCVPQRSGGNNKRSSAQLENQENLKNNERGEGLSRKAVRRLTNAVNWLVASAKNKSIYYREENKRFNFKINFVTLTLPTLDHGISDHHFKSKLLHNFINTCRYKFDMKNFVWKVETQENGNIHAHFTTDTFIHWKDLRKVWNRILEKNGIIDQYHDKHKNLDFEEYNKIYNASGKKEIEKVRKAFEQGKNDNWRNPNTTDVHAVHKVKDIAAYLAKYMSKSDEERRQIKGRLWGCSQALSETNKMVLEICGSKDYDLFDDLFSPEIKYKPIEVPDKFTGKPRKIGEMFFFKLSDWGTKIKGRLLEEFNKHRFNIRYGIEFESLKQAIAPPEAIANYYEVLTN